MKLYSNNKAVCISIALDDSLCKKKYTAIAFYKLREAAAAGSICSYHISSKENRSDFLTKATGWYKHNMATNRTSK